MRPLHGIILPFLVLGFAFVLPLGAAAQSATKCTADVIKVKISKRHFRGTATVRVKRSKPSRAVELSIGGVLKYRHPDGTNTATSLSSVHIQPSKNKNENVTVTIRPDTRDPDAWVNVHCAKSDRCKISDISLDQIACWDYAKKPKGRLEIGEPKVKKRKSQ